MLLNVPLIIDLIVIRNRRQALVDKNLKKIGMKNYKEDKMLLKLLGLYSIVQVFTNGTVDIQQTPTVRDRMS